MVGLAVIVVLAGLGIIWLAVRMWRERVPRNALAGVRTPSTMRSDEAFRVANKAAAPLTGLGGAILAATGLVTAFVPASVAGVSLLIGVVIFGALCVAGAAMGIRACRSL